MFIFFFLSVGTLPFFIVIGPVSGQHRVADLILASLIAALTFKVAYRASLVLGTVLLQTSPRRGLANGKMEAFLRAMREVCFPPCFKNILSCYERSVFTG